MKPFLKQICDYLFETYSDDLSSLCIVFPNARPALYFRKYLVEKIKKPTWAPRIESISSFFEKQSLLQNTDELTALVVLYNEYCNLKQNPESFDQFYAWGKIMLSDFDDIDKYMADARQIFANVSDLKQIDEQFESEYDIDSDLFRSFWGSILQSKSSGEKKNFLETWALLSDLYTQHRTTLKARNLGTQGMIFRDIAENPRAIDASQIYCFAGFNVLTKCEQLVFEELKKQRKALFFWDIDNWYISNPHHEAGLFLRDNVKTFAMPDDFKAEITDLRTRMPHIQCIAAPSNVAQVKFTGEYLASSMAQPEFRPEETALILGNEDLLPLLLHSIPEEAGAFNVSMGFAINNSEAVAWFRNVLLMQQKLKPGSSAKFYHKYVLSLLNHRITQWLYNDTQGLVDSIFRNNISYIDEAFFSGKGDLPLLFHYAGNDVDSMGNYLLKLLEKVLQQESDESDYEKLMQREILYCLYKSVLQLQLVIKREKVPFTGIALYLHLIDQILKTTLLPFEGEPLQGMQLLGLLETRLLDFKNIIVLSLNEGMLPKSGLSPSFIPANLRYACRLPSREHVDSLYSYYFYRLLQRADNICLVYKMASKDVGGGEKSRFLYQLQYELFHNMPFHHIQYNIVAGKRNVIEVKKDAAMLEYLQRLVSGNMPSKKLSASVLNMYLKCPFAFYLSAIVGVKEPESIDEEIEAKHFGVIFHNSMNTLYKPLLLASNLQTTTELKTLLSNREAIHKVLLTEFNNVYKTDFESIDSLTGKYRLFFEIVLGYILQTLGYDNRNKPEKLLGLEKTVETNFFITEGTTSQTVHLKAVVDRIDQISGIIRVLDYKTGKATKNAKDLNQLFERKRDNQPDYVFQVMLYCMMLQINGMYDKKLQPAILSLTDLFGETDTHIYFDKEPVLWYNDELHTLFLARLRDLIEEILNRDIHFSQAPSEKKCQYCAFSQICHTV